MELNYMNALPLGGFNYDNCIRNKALEQSKAGNQVKTMKTGTTICGVVFKVSTILSALTNYFGNRTESYLLLIPEPLEETSLETKIAKKFITWHQIFTVQVQEPQLIAIM